MKSGPDSVNTPKCLLGFREGGRRRVRVRSARSMLHIPLKNTYKLDLQRSLRHFVEVRASSAA